MNGMAGWKTLSKIYENIFDNDNNFHKPFRKV